MVHLINKDALVAEIENRIKELQNLHKENEEKLDSIQKTAILLCIDECKVILSFIDTLEVKGVDLEKEIGEYLSTYWPEEKELHPFLGHVAKHFFELGRTVSNKAQKGE